MLAHFIDEIGRCPHVDEIFVWTESEKVADVAIDSGAIVLKRPMEMVHYGSGFHKVSFWFKYMRSQIESKIGVPKVWATLNCNYVLMRNETLTDMIDVLLSEKKSIGRVSAIVPVEPGICIDHERSGLALSLFPDLEGIVRRIGISADRLDKLSTVHRPFLISWEEGRDVQNLDDIPFAEYILHRRINSSTAL
jgi:hypothetical protein